jgi:opacity protein-like surface antigen
MKKIAIVFIALFSVSAFAQTTDLYTEKSVFVSLGWRHFEIDNANGDPFDGVDLGAGFGILFPVSDIVMLGSSISIRHMSVSANETGIIENVRYKAKATISYTGFNLTPQIRIGEVTKYVGVGFGISLPISSKYTEKFSVSAYNYDTTETVNLNPDISYGLSIGARYSYIGAGIGFPLNNNDNNSWNLGINIFLPLSTFIAGDLAEKIEIEPSFTYIFQNNASEFSLQIGVEYSF